MSEGKNKNSEGQPSKKSVPGQKSPAKLPQKNNPNPWFQQNLLLLLDLPCRL